MRSIGFDFGSGTTKAIVLDAQGAIETTLYRRKAQDDLAAIDAFLHGIGGPCRTFSHCHGWHRRRP